MKYHKKICKSKNQEKIIDFAKIQTNKHKNLKLHEKEEIKTLQANFVANSHSAFSIVEDSHLKILGQKLIEIGAKYSNIDISSVWYGRHTIKEHIINKVEDFKNQLKPMISKCLSKKTIVGSTDIWTDSVVRQSYIDFSIHFLIESEHKTACIGYKYFVLNFYINFILRFMPESHTGINISNIINNIGQEFGITSINIPYVTDSASNMKLAFKNSTWIPCMLHRLHTAISSAWELTLDEDPEIKILYTKMLKVRSFFHKSANKESLLPYKLPNDSPTRPWCGLSQFFCSFVKSYAEIKEISLESNFDVPTDFELIKLLSNFFEIFEKPFKIMQASTSTTIHLVTLCAVEMFNEIDKISDRLMSLKINIKQSNLFLLFKLIKKRSC